MKSIKNQKQIDLGESIAEARNSKKGNRKGEPIAIAKIHERSEREMCIETGKSDKYFFLNEKNILPEIDPNDLRFAETVFAEYSKIPFDDLCWLIRDLRYVIQKYQEDYDVGMLSMNENFWEKLCGKEIEFKSISITSNKGTIDVMANHPLFEHYFSPQLKKIRLLHREILESQSKEVKFYMVDLPFSKIWIFLNTTDLGEFQKRVVAGMFLVYFKLYKVKSIMKEIEWKENPTYATTYKHYLSDIVKTWLKEI
jgi:hypothetical protein